MLHCSIRNQSLLRHYLHSIPFRPIHGLAAPGLAAPRQASPGAGPGLVIPGDKSSFCFSSCLSIGTG